MLQIQLQKFEGPLGLLLYLIRKEEMDIFDIQIHQITTQYLEYMKQMQELDLETAGDFIAMASTLLQIKSRMLLPQYDENGEIIETEDPRKELVQKLLEYQKYQEAAHKLYERPLLNRDVFARGIREKLEAKGDDILLEENALFGMISVYRKMMKNINRRFHQVTSKTQSIASRILEMKDRLVAGMRVTLSDLIDATQERRRQVLITFLSLLELGKLGFVTLYQGENFAEIHIDTKMEIAGDAISRVEEYDSMRADDVAELMMAKAMKLEQMEEATVDIAESSDPDLGAGDEAVAWEEDSLPVNEREIASDDEIIAAEKDLDLNDDAGVV